MPAITKELRFFRHSHRVPGGEAISWQGLEAACEAARFHIRRPVSDVFHSPIPRTLQTLTAMMTGHLCFRDAVQHPAIINIGDPEFTQKMINEDFIRLITENGLSGLEAARQTLSPDQLIAWSMKVSMGIRGMFDLMTGNFAVAIGHDPSIVLAALAHEWHGNYSLDPLDFIDFVRYDNGHIVALKVAL